MLFGPCETLHNTDKPRIDFRDEVVVLVGVTEQRFVAHKTMLCESSEFMQTACTERWLGAPEKVIRLPEQDPVAFDIYLNWRYTGSIDLWNGVPNESVRTDSDGVQRPNPGDRYSVIVKCYVLGDMLLDNEFSNALIDSFKDLSRQTHCVPRPKVANLAFELLGFDSPLRKLIVHETAYQAGTEYFQRLIDKYHPDITKELAKLLHADLVEHPGSARRLRARDGCYFHKHRKGDSCGSKR